MAGRDAVVGVGDVSTRRTLLDLVNLGGPSGASAGNSPFVFCPDRLHLALVVAAVHDDAAALGPRGLQALGLIGLAAYWWSLHWS